MQVNRRIESRWQLLFSSGQGFSRAVTAVINKALAAEGLAPQLPHEL